jgi:hydrogenase expression/formation protein HypE
MILTHPQPANRELGNLAVPAGGEYPGVEGAQPPGITRAHGGGGEMTRLLIEEHILPRLGNRLLNPLTDGAILPAISGRPVFTTDAFVVQPLEFPGGDIGRLAVCGTVNDLAVMGAVPRALSLALIAEEGLPLPTLDRILDSIAQAAKEADVQIATGDTKVVERRHTAVPEGRSDGLWITTAGIGELRNDVHLSTGRIQCGDAILVSGRIAEHGLAVMSAREGLGFESGVVSDVAALHELVAVCLQSGADVRFMRDPTRSGLAGVLTDLAESTGLSIDLREDALPLSRSAWHLAEALGLDPLTVANEGKVVAVVAAEDAPRLRAACRAHPLGQHAEIIGEFSPATPPLVELLTSAGGRRVVRRPYGEELPRIC